MLKNLCCKAMLAIALVSSFSAYQANADCGSGLGYAVLYGYGGFNNNLYSRTIVGGSVPYFSMHPPVYYGQRYMRPYGVSPFASLPQLSANPAYAPEIYQVPVPAQTVQNPHPPVPGVVKSPAANKIVVAEPIKPLVIQNPYYTGDSLSGQAEVQFTSK